MKNLFIILTLAILTMPITALAENNEWGTLFRESLEKYRNDQIEPEDKGLNIYKWKYKKNELINNYKQSLEEDTNANISERAEIISSYYYDNTDSEIDKIVDFFIFVINFEKIEKLKISAISALMNIAFKGNTKASNYIYSQTKNRSLSHRLNLQFHLANITIQKDRQSLDYLISLIKKAQNVETTDINFNSKDEAVIIWFLIRTFFPKRFYADKEYEFAIPLIREMIFSKSKNVQNIAISSYLKHTNKLEIKKIYDDCWSKVHDKTTSKGEYVKALYGLQALYFLEKKYSKKYKIEFKGIGSYFSRLGTYILAEDRKKFTESKSESRISKKQKEYFIKRLDH